MRPVFELREGSCLSQARLIALSFMMHEYVSYHRAGEPATVIKNRYQQEVLAGVADWLRILSPHVPKQEIVNYCVGLYYNRSMVTLAGIIMEQFKDAAYCPGETISQVAFPDNLQVRTAKDGRTKDLAAFKGDRLFSFVSDRCPVSMAATVLRARKIAEENKPVSLIVVPLEKVSDKHLAMHRMITGGNLLFVSDEQWRQQSLPVNIRLPYFMPSANGSK